MATAASRSGGLVGRGRTLVVVAALFALAGFFLPWVLVLFDIPVSAGDLAGLPLSISEIHLFALVLDSSGYDLAAGRIAEGSFGDTREVQGDDEYLVFLIAPAALAVLAAGHRLLRARDRKAAPILTGILACLAAGFLVDRMVLSLDETVANEIRKRVPADELEAREANFEALESRAVPRLEVGFWMCLFGYAGILSGSFLWYREGVMGLGKSA